MKIALGSDHGGYALKCDIIQLLEKPAEHVAAQMDAFVQLQRKGLGGRGRPRRHHARDQINLPFRKSTSREKMCIRDSGDAALPLTKSEYAICEHLATHAGQVFSKEQIYEAVFGLSLIHI